MRSVHIFLKSPTSDDVARYLSTIADRVGERWSILCGEVPGLEIGILDDLEDFEQEDAQAVLKSLQQIPSLVVYADVSGRIDGEHEVRGFVLSLLRAFDGVALDDHSSHCWTIPELESGEAIDGLVFFRGDVKEN